MAKAKYKVLRPLFGKNRKLKHGEIVSQEQLKNLNYCLLRGFVEVVEKEIIREPIKPGSQSDQETQEKETPQETKSDSNDRPDPSIDSEESTEKSGLSDESKEDQPDKKKSQRTRKKTVRIKDTK